MFLRLAITTFALAAGPVCAADLPQPEGEVILTVSGDLGVTNAGDTAEFDLAMLEDLGVTEFETSTIWTDGPQRFEGVEINTLLAALEAEGGALRATAINNYSIEIPAGDTVEGGAILAYRRNGEEMSIRDKGPIWVVYPYDANAAYRTEVIYSRSIWQLDRLEVVN